MRLIYKPSYVWFSITHLTGWGSLSLHQASHIKQEYVENKFVLFCSYKPWPKMPSLFPAGTMKRKLRRYRQCLLPWPLSLVSPPVVSLATDYGSHGVQAWKTGSFNPVLPLTWGSAVSHSAGIPLHIPILLTFLRVSRNTGLRGRGKGHKARLFLTSVFLQVEEQNCWKLAPRKHHECLKLLWISVCTPKKGPKSPGTLKTVAWPTSMARDRLGSLFIAAKAAICPSCRCSASTETHKLV